jgi:hypothetical protein
MVMADLALTHSEVRPVTESLEKSGFQITGLHNHLLRIEGGSSIVGKSELGFESAD